MPGEIGARQRWMRLLALAEPDHLERCLRVERVEPTYDWIKPPETGLILVRARVAGIGQRFNFGELTVTRCVLQLPRGPVGAAFVAGRNHRHAELAAIFDALLQDPARFEDLNATLIEPVETAEQARRRSRESRVAPTKVDFFAQTSDGPDPGAAAPIVSAGR